MPDVSRRALIKATAVGAAMLPGGLGRDTASAQDHTHGQNAPQSPSQANPAHGAHTAAQDPSATYLFLNDEEAALIVAAVARLIPADDRWPGAVEAGVPNYIDKQLAGAWGAGERLYRSGPWQQGAPTQGYQLPFTPAELFHTALRAIIRDLEKRGAVFAELA